MASNCSLIMNLQLVDISLRISSSLALLRFSMAIRKRAPLEHPIYALLYLV